MPVTCRTITVCAKVWTSTPSSGNERAGGIPGCVAPVEIAFASLTNLHTVLRFSAEHEDFCPRPSQCRSSVVDGLRGYRPAFCLLPDRPNFEVFSWKRADAPNFRSGSGRGQGVSEPPGDNDQRDRDHHFPF